MEDLATRALQALGITHAVTHTEIKLGRTGPQVIEVNARLGGWVEQLFQRAGAGSPLRDALEIALREYEPHPHVPEGVTMCYFPPLPPGTHKLRNAPQNSELARLPGVFRIDRFKNVDDDLDSRDGTFGRVMDVWIEASDHDQLRERFERVRDSLDSTLVFEPR